MGTRASEVGADAGVGLYLHLPFCERVCPYCDFAVVAARHLSPARAAAYRDLLLRELALRRPVFEALTLRSVYFGGGTPSLFPPTEIERLLSAAALGFPGEPEEVTLEANPSRAEFSRFREFRSAGVTRLSLGAQAFTDRALKRLGRAQTAREVCAALDAARRADFGALSVDLIFATPGQRLADLSTELELLANWAPDHVSIYELTIEARTPFELAENRGQLDRAGEDEVADMHALIQERLGTWGLERYEVSNYARRGHESRHNRRYWRREPVLGLGVGAWSLEPRSAGAPFGRRPGNRRGLDAYRADVEAGAPAPLDREPLRSEQARGEAMFLALRTRDGVDVAAFETEFGGTPRFFFTDAIEGFVAEGLLVEGLDGDLRMTERGILVADSVATAFV